MAREGAEDSAQKIVRRVTGQRSPQCQPGVALWQPPPPSGMDRCRFYVTPTNFNSSAARWHALRGTMPHEQVIRVTKRGRWGKGGKRV